MVQVGGGGQAQQALEQDLAWCGVQQVGTAHHVGDALVGVVHHHGQLVGIKAVGAADNEIPHLPGHVLADAPCILSVNPIYAGSGAQPHGAGALAGRQAVAAGARVDGAVQSRPAAPPTSRRVQPQS
jgi:hypothetical protein